MHLSSIALKGFKSFPERTRLEFGPGVSVVVGPNGSGKSNVTDAVLWAMGEQSPLAVRGQSMQDVIFAGGRGRQASQAAEVELVIDNSDGGLDVGLSEISIVRRLERGGEGEYRLNGARCRLVDVLELLSDTGLGKESHTVISQGRVESIVTSKARDRRLLVEEAAGLGKHRKRRRRAQLKLERTQDNLDRALDVEREARSHLRPLKRRAEAAELHARLARQLLEARWTLCGDELRARRAVLEQAEAQARDARARHAEVEQALAEVAKRREAAEHDLSSRAERREQLVTRRAAAIGASERVALRLEHIRAARAAIDERAAALGIELGEAQRALDAAPEDDGADERIAALAAELEALAAERGQELAAELEALDRDRAAAAAELEHQSAVVAAARADLEKAESTAAAARSARADAERELDRARRDAAQVGGELAAVNQFLRLQAGAPGDATPLAAELSVEPGVELALAAALGSRLRAALVEDRAAAARLLDSAGADGGSALVAGDLRPAPAGQPPAAGARRLLDLVTGPPVAVAAAARLLADAWLVEDLDDVSDEFTGVAVTATGRVWMAATRELRQAPAGGEDRVLAERNRRDELVSRSATAADAEHVATGALNAAGATLRDAEGALEQAGRAARDAGRRRDEAAEELRRAEWLIGRRRESPDAGPAAVRAAHVEAQLAAERRLAERAAAERSDRTTRVARLQGRIAREKDLVPALDRAESALAAVAGGIGVWATQAGVELDADRAEDEALAGALRASAQEEAAVQAMLKERGEAVTGDEVRAQQARDQAAEAKHELAALAAKLTLEAQPPAEPLSDEERESITARIERLERRREQLGPVNPLAEQEYSDAVAYVDELETQRTDLEGALRELRALIRDIDREIRETFERTFNAAAQNFEELVPQLFPGGRGVLRLVREDAGPRPVLGGAELEQSDSAGDEEEAEAEERGDAEEDLLGVEIEITPAGKSTKRLSLLSGGEKSLTALAFLFAVFLARPCPFYILDEVEAALDDVNIDRFLAILRRYAQRAQFIVVTHQKRTMDAADVLYGVSMAGDGVSQVVSRRLPREVDAVQASLAAEAAAGAA